MQSPAANNNAAFRIAQQRKRDALRHALAGLDPEYVAKLRRDCLVAANKRSIEAGASASPDEVVREAQQDFEARVRFLTEGERS